MIFAAAQVRFISLIWCDFPHGAPLWVKSRSLPARPALTLLKNLIPSSVNTMWRGLPLLDLRTLIVCELGFKILNAQAAELAIARPGQQRGLQQSTKFRVGGIHETPRLVFLKILNASHVDAFEWFDPTPSVV